MEQGEEQVRTVMEDVGENDPAPEIPPNTLPERAQMLGDLAEELRKKAKDPHALDDPEDSDGEGWKLGKPGE